MSRRPLTSPALWIALVSLVLATGCDKLDPMRRQQKYKAYQASDFYADGLSMRAPPPGTVTHGVPLDPAVTAGVGPDGKPLQTIPVAVTPALLATGRKRFDIVCATCHGPLGDGRSVVATKMSLRPPPSIHDFRDRPDGFFYQVINQGFGLMPSYATQLSVQERWAVVAYVRALQLSQHAPLSAAPPDEQARLRKVSP
jgi:mono/diheme cytochrome c family protein